MIYIHTINTSLESNNENDDDVIELITYLFNSKILYFDCKYSRNYKYKAINTLTYQK